MAKKKSVQGMTESGESTQKKRGRSKAQEVKKKKAKKALRPSGSY